jgi:8-oxo-dGTP pyrophosphatase MutT (NUDIX family)
VIYDNPWEWLGQVDVELPDEEQFWHHVVRLHRAAMMVLLDEQDRVLLPWRHRFVQDRWWWELPGGLIDEGEEPAETAARELEETGYRAGRVEHLITFQPMVSLPGEDQARLGVTADWKRGGPLVRGRPDRVRDRRGPGRGPDRGPVARRIPR